MSEHAAGRAEVYVMHLTDHADIPSAEVPHVGINEEIVRLHIIRPAIQHLVSPAIPFTVYGESADEKLFHGTGIHLAHVVHLHGALQYR